MPLLFDGKNLDQWVSQKMPANCTLKIIDKDYMEVVPVLEPFKPNGFW
jgi:hypothetical protein